MAEIKARIVDFALSFNRKQRLTLELEGDFRGQYDKLRDKDLDVTIKKWNDHRTLTANAYLWALVGKIGDALRMNKDEVYFDMLKAYGQGGAVSVEERFVEDFMRTYKYSERLGETELNGKTFVHFRFWVGSHEYSREEFSILLDGVAQEAKNLGIETMDEQNLKSLREAYQ